MTTGYGSSSQIIPLVVKVQAAEPDYEEGGIWIDSDASSAFSTYVVTTVTVDTTLTTAFEVVNLDASAGSFTIILPPIADALFKWYLFKMVGDTSNTVTIDPDGTEQIDDALTAVFTTQFESFGIYNDAVKWWIE